MKLKVYENRQIDIIQTIGTQNENEVELIELEVPEKYQEWNKKIVFVMENEIYWDFVQDETYLVTKAISKNKEVGIYVWLTNNEQDFRSETKTVYFNNNVDASEQITPEEEAEANRFIAYIEEEKQELEDLITEVQTKLDNGDFNGKDGQDGQDGQDGKDGVDGQDGFSPIISITQTMDGYDLEITDKNGTRTISINNGLDGEDGKDGKDGEKGEKGDPGEKGEPGQPGTNGKDGKDGENGKDGKDGADGQDGYTPIRGTDYWTNQDIATIEQYCADYIDANITDAIGGAY